MAVPPTRNPPVSAPEHELIFVLIVIFKFITANSIQFDANLVWATILTFCHFGGFVTFGVLKLWTFRLWKFGRFDVKQEGASTVVNTV